MTYSKVLIAVDTSEFSMKAAKKGLELARQLSAEAALLFIIDKSKAVGNMEAGILPEQALIVLKKEAQKTLDELISQYGDKETLQFMPEGYPTDDILKTAEVWGADILVVGTHGRTGLKHLLMGSIAEEIVRRSTIPVMVCR